jgi:hypothetical protein
MQSSLDNKLDNNVSTFDKAKYLRQFMSPQKYGPDQGGSIRDKANLIMNRNSIQQFHRTERKPLNAQN